MASRSSGQHKVGPYESLVYSSIGHGITWHLANHSPSYSLADRVCVLLQIAENLIGILDAHHRERVACAHLI